MTHDVPKAAWPYSLPRSDPETQARVRERAQALSDAAQYGWGHTVPLGGFVQQGLLGDEYLRIAGALDLWGWWARDLSGMTVADVGCFTGGLSLYMAARNPTVVHAVDEVPAHLEQCEFLAELHGISNVATHVSSIYRLHDALGERTLDLALVSGVLYHLSDMLLGLHVVQRLLKPGSTLILETNAVDDESHSYANFGRFFAGMWWQPTSLCVRDMCDYMGYEDIDVRFHAHQRCLVRATATGREIPFKRGINWDFTELGDSRVRSMDPGIMAPAAAE